jgi:metal-responsive CopG/Arc/MetJ family transcriptional regulator
MTDELITISLKAEPEVIAKLDNMVKAEDTDRSKLIRKLIRKEYELHYVHIPIVGTLTGKGDNVGDAITRLGGRE